MPRHVDHKHILRPERLPGFERGNDSCLARRLGLTSGRRDERRHGNTAGAEQGRGGQAQAVAQLRSVLVGKPQAHVRRTHDRRQQSCIAGGGRSSTVAGFSAAL